MENIKVEDLVDSIYVANPNDYKETCKYKIIGNPVFKEIPIKTPEEKIIEMLENIGKDSEYKTFKMERAEDRKPTKIPKSSSGTFKMEKFEGKIIM
jgi:hypothetical protein